MVGEMRGQDWYSIPTMVSVLVNRLRCVMYEA